MTTIMKSFVLTFVLIGLVAAQNVSNRCPSTENPRSPVQFAHPTDCTRYFRCIQGNARELSCPQNMHWNAANNKCDFQERAGCMSAGVIPPRLPVPAPPRQNPSPGGSDHPSFLNCPQTDVPGRVVYFPHHLNCSQFYQCVRGRAVLLGCPRELVWNINGNYCDRAQNVNCQIPRHP